VTAGGTTDIRVTASSMISSTTSLRSTSSGANRSAAGNAALNRQVHIVWRRSARSPRSATSGQATDASCPPDRNH
jgi:hypothetical protein